MYSNYVNFIDDISSQDISRSDFKSNERYNYILEHVSKDIGNEYLQCIEKEFPEIKLQNIIEFLKINDAFGVPLKEKMNIYGITVDCSPTSTRYVYHALIILKYLSTTSCKKVVEVGCGYGGLYLAICHFSKILKIEIDEYHFIDFPEVGRLIDKYMILNKDTSCIPYKIHDSSMYGEDIKETDLFFISNYCFTEIDITDREKYIQKLLNKTSSGFILWQTVFDRIHIENINFCKEIKSIEEERPQTARIDYKNYFVYF
jgi:hypothetical protein